MGDDGKTTDILSVCTGCFIAGQAGVFKGKKASGPRPVVGTLQKLFPDTEWINDKRWVNDGNIWSSGKFPFWNLRIMAVYHTCLEFSDLDLLITV